MTSSPQTSRYATKRELILAAAARLFNAQGIRGTTLTQVAQSVGLGTTSVTYYFRKKEDLAEAAFLQTLTAIVALTERATTVAGQPAQHPEAWLRAYMALYAQSLAAIETGDRPEFTNFSDVRALTDPQRAIVFAAFADMFRKVRRLFDGLMLSRAARNSRTHLLVSIHLWMPAWLNGYDPTDFGDAADRVCDLLLGGLDPGGTPWPSAPHDAPEPQEPGPEGTFLAAATALINEQGYSGASIERIASRLNVTKGAFYHRNDAKDDLVAACHDRTQQTVRRVQDQARGRHDRAWSRLSATCIDLVTLEVRRPGSLLRTTALATLPSALRRDRLLATDRLSRRYAGLVAEGMIDGSIRPVDPAIAGSLIESMINAAVELTDWVPDLTSESASLLYVRPLFRGILSVED